MSVQSYFLGANSASGFYSCYENFCTPKNDDFLWVIKGGPGCGKSTFMRKIGKAAENAGYDVEYVICSGDPDSIDGVYIPKKKVGYVDGTSPHVIDVSFPAVCGQYLDLGRFYDTDALTAHKAEIMDVNLRYKELYRKAYDFLSAIPKIVADTKSPKNRKTRFMTAITCQGIITISSGLPQKTVSAVHLAKMISESQENDILYLHPLWPQVVTALYSKSENAVYQMDLPIPDCDDVLTLLARAKELHDQLEKIYNPYVDFDSVYNLASQHIEKYL